MSAETRLTRAINQMGFTRPLMACDVVFMQVEDRLRIQKLAVEADTEMWKRTIQPHWHELNYDVPMYCVMLERTCIGIFKDVLQALRASTTRPRFELLAGICILLVAPDGSLYPKRV